MIPAEAIADVRSRVELVGFLASCGVTLKRHGEGYLGLCPLHRDTRPSLSVDAKKQVWCCLGACSAEGKPVGGDVIEFARRFWGVGFLEALKRLGASTSVTLPSPAPRSSRPSLAPVRILAGRSRRGPGGDGHGGDGRFPTALLSRVVGVYHDAFLASERARDYAAGRGLRSQELLSALPIGYADGTLLERVAEGSRTWEELRGAGVLGGSNGSTREHFSGCLVVPLRDLSGEVVGLYGRAVEEGRGVTHLYLPGPRRGLVNATCAATTDELVLTESVIDALSFLEAGIPNAVPLYGKNGWTPDHDALLETHRIGKVVLALDADEAGRSAARALSGKLAARGIEVEDVVLPVKDPNQLLVAEGPEGFVRTWRRLLGEASAIRRASAVAPATPAPRGPEAPVPSLVPVPGPTLLVPPHAPPKASESGSEKREPPALALDETGTYVLPLDSRTWRVKGLSAFGVDRLRVNLRVEQAIASGTHPEASRFHVDTFDLYSARSRQAFVEAAVRTLRLEEDETAPLALRDEIALLIEALEKERLSLRQKGQGPASSEAPALTPEERQAALAFLRGDILGRLREDFRAAGLVGEETALLIGYLALVSRTLREPLSVLFCARSGAGKSVLQDRLCDLCPPEDLVKYTRISGQVLFYKDPKALEHKLLAVDEEDGAAQAAYALRSLLSSGYLSCSVTRTDPQTGRQVADDRRVEGPTAVFLTSAHPEALDYETRNRFVLLTVDESREQTRRILELQRWSETLEGLMAREERSVVFKRHHDAQRLVLPLDVVIPVELTYPSGWLILRREQRKYLSLVKALALLHQHQRPRRTLTVGGKAVEYVEATEADVAVARELAPSILRRNLDELSPPSRSLLVALKEIVAGKRKALGATKGRKDEEGRDDGRDGALRDPGGALRGREAGRADGSEEHPAGVRRFALAGRKGQDERLLVDRHELQRATGLSYWHVRTYVAQLVEYEYVALVRGSQGKRALYELLWDGAEEADPWAAA